jgi:hypothetical protein
MQVIDKENLVLRPFRMIFPSASGYTFVCMTKLLREDGVGNMEALQANLYGLAAPVFSLKNFETKR